MASFDWDRHFITGIKDVDEQHHQLVDLINEFGDHLASNELVIEDINKVLGELLDYTHYHFQDEERLMAEKGVDARHIKLQKDAHNYFCNEVKAIKSAISADNTATLKYLLDFLTHWLAYHILGADQNMARQIACIDAGMSPEEAYAKEEQDSDSSTEPLLKALNGLFHQIAQRNQQLVELNESLEEKVRERTQELTIANENLEKLSITDALTGLPNRRYAMQKLSKLWEEAVDHDGALACMMLDADHFKEINDLYGHDAGDQVLCELSKQLLHAVRTDDIVCRLGGDEFLIICPATDLEGVKHVANKLHGAVVAMSVNAGEGVWEGSISVGLAVKSEQMGHYNELIKQADQAVYLAKDAGKNCVRHL